MTRHEGGKTPRIALVTSELLMGISAAGGGVALLAGAMDGWLPLAWLTGSPLADYRLPALALIVFVGCGNLTAAVLILMRRAADIPVSLAAGCFLVVFEIVEAAVLGLRFWLQPFCFLLGIVIVALGLRLWLARRLT